MQETNRNQRIYSDDRKIESKTAFIFRFVCWHWKHNKIKIPVNNKMMPVDDPAAYYVSILVH